MKKYREFQTKIFKKIHETHCEKFKKYVIISKWREMFQKSTFWIFIPNYENAYFYFLWANAQTVSDGLVQQFSRNIISWRKEFS